MSAASQPPVPLDPPGYPPLEVHKPKWIRPPCYPSAAVARGIEGFVDFEFTINPDGSVAHPRVIQEYPRHSGFATCAQEVFPSWTFVPDIVDGVPVATPARYRMSFKMH